MDPEETMTASSGRTARILRAGVLGLMALGAIWFVLFVFVRTPPVVAGPLFDQVGRPLIIAHQGGEGIRPGNTLEAFVHAWEIGAPMSEMDLHTSADGLIVLIHDDTVNATTSGSGRTIDFTAAALAELDAAYHWSPDNGLTHPFRGTGIGVPTLEEVFDALPDAWYNLEIKQTEPSLVPLACEMIRSRRLEDRTLMASFSSSALREFRRECPGIATSAGAWEARLFLLLHHLRLTRVWTPPFEAIQLPPKSKGLTLLTPRLLMSAWERGLEVHAWTINEVDEMERLLNLGVDGLVTDYPDRLLNLLESR